MEAFGNPAILGGPVDPGSPVGPENLEGVRRVVSTAEVAGEIVVLGLVEGPGALSIHLAACSAAAGWRTIDAQLLETLCRSIKGYLPKRGVL